MKDLFCLFYWLEIVPEFQEGLLAVELVMWHTALCG